MSVFVQQNTKICVQRIFVVANNKSKQNLELCSVRATWVVDQLVQHSWVYEMACLCYLKPVDGLPDPKVLQVLFFHQTVSYSSRGQIFANTYFHVAKFSWRLTHGIKFFNTKIFFFTLYSSNSRNHSSPNVWMGYKNIVSTALHSTCYCTTCTCSSPEWSVCFNNSYAPIVSVAELTVEDHQLRVVTDLPRDNHTHPHVISHVTNY